MNDKRSVGKAVGGKARAASLSAEERSAIAKSAADARWAAGPVLRATHGDDSHPLRIAGLEIPCYVLEDGRRVLQQTGLIRALNMSHGGSYSKGGDRLAKFATQGRLKSYVSNELIERTERPIKFRTPAGSLAYGYEATVLAELCEAVLSARSAGVLQKQQEHIATQAEILVRGFARIGIIALVDEATGYERDRIAGSLAKILEAFIDKELRAWVRTFPAEYYEQLFRLRGLAYSSDSVKRPQYFGVLTNDIVYKRLAPGVLDELKKITERDDDGRPKTKYFQRLTANVGYPKLREHLGSVVTLMKLSSGYSDFKKKLDSIHPEYGTTMPMNLKYEPENDEGNGI
jgi:hypothetical protein